MIKDEQWRRAMEYVSMVSELNYMSQIVVMLYEDPTKDPCSEERFHVELHFSPGVNCCVQKNLPPGPGFRPHSRNESSHNMVSIVNSEFSVANILKIIIQINEFYIGLFFSREKAVVLARTLVHSAVPG